MKPRLLAFVLSIAAGCAHAQQCFGPVVAGVCHDAQSEMQRMQQRQDHEAIQQLQRGSSASGGAPIVLGARRAVKRERELTDALITEVSTNPSDVVKALIAEGRGQMTAEQHEEFRAKLRRVVESEKLVRETAALCRQFILEHPSQVGGDEQLARSSYIVSIDSLERLASLNYYENASGAVNNMLAAMQQWANHLREVR